MISVNQNKFYRDHAHNSNDVEINLTNNNSKQSDNGGRAIEEPLTRRTKDWITDYRSYQNGCNIPLNKILGEVHEIVQQADLANF